MVEPAPTPNHFISSAHTASPVVARTNLPPSRIVAGVSSTKVEASNKSNKGGSISSTMLTSATGPSAITSKVTNNAAHPGSTMTAIQMQQHPSANYGGRSSQQPRVLGQQRRW